MKALGAGPLAHEAYKDILQPAAREIGNNLLLVAKAISIAMAPLEATIWGYERIKDWLSIKIAQKLAHIDPTQIQSPKLTIAGPTITNMRFAMSEEDIREMYATLVASAMNKNMDRLVHPAFPSIIQQLTPDEAKILRYISKQNSPQIVHQRMRNNQLLKKSIAADESLKQIGELSQIEFPHEIDLYCDNLIRLKLFRENRYEEGEYREGGHNRHGEYGPSIDTIETYDIDVSRFGDHFIRCCLDQPNWDIRL